MEERNFFVLAYDITQDKRRTKIAKLMESIGTRVQGSVFEAYLGKKELEALVKKSNRILDKEEDSLRIYFLCETCRGKIVMHGKGRLTPPPGVMIV